MVFTSGASPNSEGALKISGNCVSRVATNWGLPQGMLCAAMQVLMKKLLPESWTFQVRLSQSTLLKKGGVERGGIQLNHRIRPLLKGRRRHIVVGAGKNRHIARIL